jgi:uncharacterized protein YndB with AHSA1/START domain
MEPLEMQFTVACSCLHAFEVWTAKTSLWWPHDHSVSGQPGLQVTIEPGPGGRIFEQTRDGTEHDWGRVLVWEPPLRLRYLWHIGGDPVDATEVEVTFTDEGESTRVVIVHRGWERLGASGPDRRERNRKGWAGLLPHYERACAGLPG